MDFKLKRIAQAAPVIIWEYARDSRRGRARKPPGNLRLCPAEATVQARPSIRFPNGPILPDLLPLAAVSAADVEALLDAAFGPERRGRTAYRVRAGLSPIDALSFAKVEDGRLVGCIQCWPVQLNGDDGGALPLVMVGPVAVAPDRQGTGIGHALMQRAIAAAGEDAPLMLVGDAPYYQRFGFTAERTGGWRMPGPYEQARLLARGGMPFRAGILAPRIALAA